MGIGFTNLEPVDIVVLSDTALEDVEHAKIRKYEMTRKLSDLPESIWQSNDPPVVFRVKPLSVQWESVALTMDAGSIRALIREHIVEIKRGKTSRHSGFTWKDGKLTEDSLNSLPIKVCSEIASFIVQAQDRVPGGAIPFSPISQPGWLADRENSKRLQRLVDTMSAIESATASETTAD